MFFRTCCGLLFLLFSLRLTAQPLFDSHLHYTADDAQRFTPRAILNLLDKNAVTYAAVTGSPSAHVSKLYHFAPERIVPLLSVYHHSGDKTTWTNDKALIPYLEKELKRGYWRGIGELHVFARDRHSKVFKQVITLASAWQLPLLIHGDPAVIDKVYEIAPKQPVIWAHAGTFPYPDLVSDYLHRYPNLSIDLSMRDERIAPDGKINDDWYELFVNYPNRFMIGVDTYSTARWDMFNHAVSTVRNWLAQLPDEIAQQLAFVNAAKLYNKPVVFLDE
jgi:predicted TIM-barrel fold metal-dependent hydrolase